MATRPLGLSLQLNNSAVLRLPEQTNKPIKAVYPLVNLRFFSHHKYHAVKEQIRLTDKKLARSMSLSKAKTVLKGPEMSLDEGERKPLARMKTLGSQPKLLVPLLKPEPLGLPLKKVRKSVGFWHKKLVGMRRSLIDIDRMHGRVGSMS